MGFEFIAVRGVGFLLRGFKVSWFRVLGIALRVPVSGLRGLVFVFRVLDFVVGFTVSGFSCWVFGVSGSGCRVFV